MREEGVLRGTDGWLFLREGTNRSFSYLTGAEPVYTLTQHRWIATLKRRTALFPGCVHVICPEKLAVYPDKLPGTVLDEKRCAQILAKLGALYPVQPLTQVAPIEGEGAYPRTDTHFNDAGALCVTRMIYAKWGEEVDFEPQWRVETFPGDLGLKLVDKPRAGQVILENMWPLEIEDNGLRNRGRVTRFINRNAPKRRLLLFGDSFSGINLARFLTIAASEVLFVHSLSADYKVVQWFNPDVLVFELAERFLRDNPIDGSALEPALVEKALNGDIELIRAWANREHSRTKDCVDWPLLRHILNGAGHAL